MSGRLVITDRGIRLVQTLVASTVALALLLVTSGLWGPAAPDNGWTNLRGFAASTRPCPSTTSLALPTVSPARIEAARERRFSVFGPRPTELDEPIDWHTDPLGAERYRQNLHKLRFLTPAAVQLRLRRSGRGPRPGGLDRLDWVRHNPGGAGTADEAWSSKVVGDRIPFLAYMARAGACEDVLSPRDGRLLLASLTEHGEVLAPNAGYPRDNHGLFVDLGLARLTTFCLPRPGRGVARAARERFERTLRGRLSEGVWLEHSSAYQLLAIRPLESLIDVLGSDPELEELLAQMQEATVVREAGRRADPVRGLESRAGPGVGARGPARSRDRVPTFAPASPSSGPPANGDVGYLASPTASTISPTSTPTSSASSFRPWRQHHQRHGPLPQGPGPDPRLRGLQPRPQRLSVDGLDLSIADSGLTYGSGLTAAGGGDGWYAIEGRIGSCGRGCRPPAPVPVQARRRAGDRRRSRLPLVHSYIRYLQLHPDVTLGDRDQRSIQIEAPGFAGAIYDAAGESPRCGPRRAARSPLQGWSSPDFREFVPAGRSPSRTGRERDQGVDHRPRRQRIARRCRQRRADHHRGARRRRRHVLDARVTQDRRKLTVTSP